MNEKLQYASMLEIPESTCNITYKPIKRSRFKAKRVKNSEQVKQELVEKVNAEILEPISNLPEELPKVEKIEAEQSVTISQAPIKKKKAKRSIIITAQLLAVGVLAGTILLTSLLNKNSGINSLFKGVFATQSEEQITVDNRTYKDFNPVLGVNGTEYQVENGVATLMNGGSVYSSLDGTVARIEKDEQTGLYTIEIAHSNKFSSVVSGLDISYVEEGGKVYSKVPVGYAKSGGSATCFMAQGSMISNYQVVNNTVVWAV